MLKSVIILSNVWKKKKKKIKSKGERVRKFHMIAWITSLVAWYIFLQYLCYKVL
jgi:hypothetical protein